MEITVKDLVEKLQKEDQNLPIFFGGLDFYRTRQVGEHLHIEFSQTVYKGEDGNIIIDNH